MSRRRSIPTIVTPEIIAYPSGRRQQAREELLKLALARLEKRMTWAQDWTGQLYGEVVAVRSGKRTWAASWAHAG